MRPALPLAAALSVREPRPPPGYTFAAFARVPYDPSSRQAVVAIALQDWQLVGETSARKTIAVTLLGMISRPDVPLPAGLRATTTSQAVP